MSNSSMVMGQAAAAGTTPPWAWDLAYAYFDDPLAWNISSTVFTSKTKALTGLQSSPQGLSFSSDGTKMYVVGSNTPRVDELTLSTAWDISTASSTASFSVSSQDILPVSLFFKTDGTKMYVLGNASDTVNEYSLSTAWSVSTASYVQNFSVSANETAVTGLAFSSDGTKMYVIGSTGDDVNQYTLSTAWDISTASFLRIKSIASQDTSPRDLCFSPDGTKMYMLGGTGKDVNEYSLSTAWDIGTLSFIRFFSVAAQEFTPEGLFFKPDGDAMYMVGGSGDTVFQYALGGLVVSAQETDPRGVFFKPDGLKMYVIGLGDDEVNQYALSTEFDTSTAVWSSLFSVQGQDSGPVDLFFKPDGTKMYMLGTASTRVYEYNLSTAWNVTTASYSGTNFSVSAQDTLPLAIFFKSDGTRMYILGSQGKDVNFYDLSTAWNVGTAVYAGRRLVSSQEFGPSGMFFRDDGAKMYICGTSADGVTEYDLTTPWLPTSAVYVQQFSTAEQTVAPTNISFDPTGTKMFVVETNVDRVLTYTLGVQP